MKEQTNYYLVDALVLPEVFKKVLEVKKLLETKKANTINEAVQQVGISRSTYYKYKDSIFPFYEMSQGKIITLLLVLEDIRGILSDILNIIARAEANILTINQNIPVNGVANITISLQTGNVSIEHLVQKLKNRDGVKKIKILGSE